jgi:hypothetical protein
MFALTKKNIIFVLVLIVFAVAAYYVHTKYVVKKAQEKADAIGTDFKIALVKN